MVATESISRTQDVSTKGIQFVFSSFKRRIQATDPLAPVFLNSLPIQSLGCLLHKQRIRSQLDMKNNDIVHTGNKNPIDALASVIPCNTKPMVFPKAYIKTSWKASTEFLYAFAAVMFWDERHWTIPHSAYSAIWMAKEASALKQAVIQNTTCLTKQLPYKHLTIRKDDDISTP